MNDSLIDTHKYTDWITPLLVVDIIVEISCLCICLHFCSINNPNYSLFFFFFFFLEIIANFQWFLKTKFYILYFNCFFCFIFYLLYFTAICFSSFIHLFCSNFTQIKLTRCNPFSSEGDNYTKKLPSMLVFV